MTVLSDVNDSLVGYITVGWGPGFVAYDPASDEAFVSN